MELLLIVAALAVVVYFVSRSQKSTTRHAAGNLDDAKADARQAIERLGGQIYNLTGTDDASRQALADAAERYTAAGSQIDQAQSPVQARLAKQTALEGLYYIRAARTAMGMDPGPEIPTLDGQKSAGAVTEDRQVEFEGRQVAASPSPSARTPTTIRAAASRVGRFPQVGTPSVVETRAGRGRMGCRFDAAVLIVVRRHGGCAVRRAGIRERRGGRLGRRIR